MQLQQCFATKKVYLLEISHVHFNRRGGGLVKNKNRMFHSDLSTISLCTLVGGGGGHCTPSIHSQYRIYHLHNMPMHCQFKQQPRRFLSLIIMIMIVTEYRNPVKGESMPLSGFEPRTSGFKVLPNELKGYPYSRVSTSGCNVSAGHPSKR